MFYTACPHCGLPLQMGQEHQGQTMQCPKCRGTLIVPVLPPPVQGRGNVPAASDDIEIPPAVWWLMIGAGHLVALVVLAIPLSFCGAFAAVLIAVAVEAVIWQWSVVSKGIERLVTIILEA